jgi:uncharacterized protein (DUF3084 family)
MAQHKMVEIEVIETSGVDHPAHLHPGWVVCKSADPGTVNNLLDQFSTEKGKNVADKETVEKAEYDTVVADRDALTAQIATLTAERDALATERDGLKTENTELVNKSKNPVEEFEKSLSEPVRQMLQKQREDITKAQEDLKKERDARLDERAISESKDLYKSIGIDHTKVAPALRRLSEVDADTAGAITEVLKAAEAQLATAGIFKEVGGNAPTDNTAVSKIDVLAKAEREANPELTEAQAIAKALAKDPALFTDYYAEKGK